jgi:hypothetical protein
MKLSGNNFNKKPDLLNSKQTTKIMPITNTSNSKEPKKKSSESTKKAIPKSKTLIN